MWTDDIIAEKYNITLQPASQAEEKYNFNRFHVHGCNHSKCEGKCGQEEPKQLSKEIIKRRRSDEQRKQEAEIKKGPPKRKLAEKLEEPGDDDFVVKRKKTPQKVDTPKPKKQARVRFADQ
ncbi:MAG: hypothetical protein Q9228_005160 [Teloschistes exilis]